MPHEFLLQFIQKKIDLKKNTEKTDYEYEIELVCEKKKLLVIHIAINDYRSQDHKNYVYTEYMIESLDQPEYYVFSFT